MVLQSKLSWGYKASRFSATPLCAIVDVTDTGSAGTGIQRQVNIWLLSRIINFFFVYDRKTQLLINMKLKSLSPSMEN